MSREDSHGLVWCGPCGAMAAVVIEVVREGGYVVSDVWSCAGCGTVVYSWARGDAPGDPGKPWFKEQPKASVQGRLF